MLADWPMLVLLMIGVTAIVTCIAMARLERKWDRERLGISSRSGRATDPFWSRQHLSRNIPTTQKEEGQ